MFNVNWLKQSVDYVLALKKNRGPLSQPYTQISYLQLTRQYSLANNIYWIEKENLITASITSFDNTGIHNQYMSWANIAFLFDTKEVGILDNASTKLFVEHVAADAGTCFIIPINESPATGCYVLTYNNNSNFSADYIDFLTVCQLEIEDRQRFLSSLQASERLKIRFKGILQTIPQSIVFIEDSGNYCWVNENAAKILDVPPGKATPATIHTAMQTFRDKASNRHEIEARAALAFTNDTVNNWHWIYTEPQQQVFDVRYQTVKTVNLSGVLWVFEDVTAQYRNDVELMQLNEKLEFKSLQAEESNKRYKYALKATSDAIWDWDFQTNALYWGEGFYNIFGYEPADIKTQENWIKQLHPDDIQHIEESLQKVINSTGNTWQSEYRYLKANGNYAYVADKGFIIRDKNGKAIRMVGAMQDITERKLAQITIKESELNLRAILESSIEGFVLLDANRLVKAYNPKAEEFIRMIMKKQCIVETSIMDYVEQARQETFNEVLNRVYEGQVMEYDRDFTKANGRTYWVHYTFTPVYHEGTVAGACLSGRDVTTLKNYLQTIEDQSKSFHEISWTQSHLVRAPLAKIMSINNLLQNSASEDEKRQLFCYLQASTEELDVIIRKITSLSNHQYEINESNLLE
jgi:PAS domain S-box-containing protein